MDRVQISPAHRATSSTMLLQYPRRAKTCITQGFRLNHLAYSPPKAVGNPRPRRATPKIPRPKRPIQTAFAGDFQGNTLPTKMDMHSTSDHPDRPDLASHICITENNRQVNSTGKDALLVLPRRMRGKHTAWSRGFRTSKFMVVLYALCKAPRVVGFQGKAKNRQTVYRLGWAPTPARAGARVVCVCGCDTRRLTCMKSLGFVHIGI